jgi:hypothetical protein
MPESLRALQQAFWALITAPTGVSDALEQQPTHAWLPRAIASNRASPVERLDVYANMYFYRLLDNLTADFSALAELMGEVAFHNLITDYLHAFPSREPSARNVGQSLPQFLRAHTPREPWLSDLAALEWARIDVHDRADEPLLTHTDLQQAAQRAFGELTLKLIVAHTQLLVTYAVEPLWRAARDGAPQPRPERSEHWVLIWRSADCRVHHRALEPDEAALLAQLTSGQPFVELCAKLRAELDDEAAAQRALSKLSAWTDAGLLVRV